jgi:hypothetical protein
MQIHAHIPTAYQCTLVYISCLALVFDAGALWHQYVQCAAVEDSNSGNRACCACFEPQYCDFDDMPREDSGYCAAACAHGAADPVCQQLAAGCGHNVRDMNNAEWGERRCSEADVKSGTCGLCMQPAWCDDSEGDGEFSSAYGTPITTAQEWMSRFTDKPFLTQDHQCKFKASQKSLFIEATHALMSKVKRDYAGSMWDRFTWNEVNMYMDGGVADGGLQQALTRNLIGLLDVQGGGAKLDDAARRLGELGLDVPKLTMTVDGFNQLDSWDPDHDANLLSWPYQVRRRN